MASMPLRVWNYLSAHENESTEIKVIVCGFERWNKRVTTYLLTHRACQRIRAFTEKKNVKIVAIRDFLFIKRYK